MPIQFSVKNSAKILTVRASGTLVKADYANFVPEFERLLQLHGKPNVLFDMTAFQSWEGGAVLDEIKFDIKHFDDMEKLAVVGSKGWERWITVFSKPFTSAKIRFFDQADAAEASHWLEEVAKGAGPGQNQ